MSQPVHNTKHSPWPHRLAAALVCIVFPLIWVGGLVTTYDAGMAVPDWPGTYGRNLFLFPFSQWVAGPFDLFVEHGHRLLGAIAGLVAIALVFVTFATDRRAVTRWLAVGALLLVIFQGVLGGARVLLDARQVALLHGCIGPLFFAYCACLAVTTSRQWQESGNAGGLISSARQGSALTRSAVSGVALAYGQLILGALLRHPADDASPHLFRVFLLFHIVVAIALLGHIAALAWSAMRVPDSRWINRPARILVALVIMQLGLGFSTLIVKYGWPAWLGGEWLNPTFTVTAQGFWSSMIVTAHVANGSLILATLAVLAVRSWRMFGLTETSDKSQVARSSDQLLRTNVRLSLGVTA